MCHLFWIFRYVYFQGDHTTITSVEPILIQLSSSGVGIPIGDVLHPAVGKGQSQRQENVASILFYEAIMVWPRHNELWSSAMWEDLALDSFRVAWAAREITSYCTDPILHSPLAGSKTGGLRVICLAERPLMWNEVVCSPNWGGTEARPLAPQPFLWSLWSSQAAAPCLYGKLESSSSCYAEYACLCLWLQESSCFQISFFLKNVENVYLLMGCQQRIDI